MTISTPNRYLAFNVSGLAGEFEVANGILGPLGSLNLFVGPNNAGKSRVIRALLKESLAYRESGIDLADLVIRLKSSSDAIAHAMASANLTSVPGLSSPRELESYCSYQWLDSPKVLASLEQKLAVLAAVPTVAPRSAVTYGGTRSSPTDDQILTVLRVVGRQVAAIHQQLLARDRSLGGERRVYVPVLRGLRHVGRDTSLDFYEERTAKDYGLRVDANMAVFTGQRFYFELQDLMLGDGAARQSVTDYERFLGQYFFDGAVTQLIPRRGDDVVHVRVGEVEYPVHQLGDGIQQLVILTFRAFTEASRALFFMEEPDMYLHAGMQRKLMELLVTHSRLSRHQYFLTTHSNHMIDMAVDYSGVSTFLVRRAGGRSRIAVVEGVERQVLGELGVRASSVFLTNATVWVEGISDRLYLREYLRRFQKDAVPKTAEVREDAHFSIMEAGGSNLAHFDFSAEAGSVESLVEAIKVARVCSNSFVVVDGDIEDKPRFEALRQSLDESSCFVLRGKEVEHLLPVEVMRAYVAQFLQAKGLEPADTSKLTAEAYQSVREPLGAILDRVFGVELFADSKTIKNKDGLMRFALDYMRSDEPWTLSEDAKLLCSKLVGWIREHNR